MKSHQLIQHQFLIVKARFLNRGILTFGFQLTSIPLALHKKSTSPQERCTSSHNLYNCSSLVFVTRRNPILLIANPIAPASYPPTPPHARIVPTLKSRGSEYRGGNASEDMPALMCNDPLGYAWERFKSKNPVDDGAGGTMWLEPRRSIHL
jgi:hypothetical protein